MADSLSADRLVGAISAACAPISMMPCAARQTSAVARERPNSSEYPGELGGAVLGRGRTGCSTLAAPGRTPRRATQIRRLAAGAAGRADTAVARLLVKTTRSRIRRRTGSQASITGPAQRVLVSHRDAGGHRADQHVSDSRQPAAVRRAGVAVRATARTRAEAHCDARSRRCGISRASCTTSSGRC